MANFFYSLVDYNLINRWGEVLDWLFDDNRFDNNNGWNSKMSGQLTRKIGKLEKIEKRNFIHDSIRNLTFPDSYYDRNETNVSIIISNNTGSKCKDLVRHIRNGIAHGHTRCKNIDGTPYIEILDYNKNTQTAYIYMPIDYIAQIYDMYVSIKNDNNEEEIDILRESA